IEMATLGERIPAPQALAWGLINRVHPEDAFEAEVEALMERLAAGPTASYAGSKRQLNARVYDGMAEQLELEASIQEEMAGSDVGAGLIVVVLTVVAFSSLPGVQAPEKSGPQISLAGAAVASVNPPKVPGGKQLRIDVNGQQYVWRYTYPDGTYSYTEMVVP